MWKVSITTTLEAEDAVAELLDKVLGSPATCYTDFESGVTTASVFCKNRPARFSAKLATLRDGMTRIGNCGLDIGRARIRAEKFARQNWAESWKRHFKPMEINETLLIKPSWSKRRPRKGQGVVVLDPGLSFGTGQHPTTSFCLKQLVRGRQSGRKQSFLDLGTGSGILAIAAAKVGYTPIHAIDFDPASVRVARANARINRVSKKVRITRGDVAKLPLKVARHYDLICANLLSTLLMEQRTKIVHRLKPGGILIIAGILRSEFDPLSDAYEKLGLRLLTSKVEKEWCSGAFLASH